MNNNADIRKAVIAARDSLRRYYAMALGIDSHELTDSERDEIASHFGSDFSNDDVREYGMEMLRDVLDITHHATAREGGEWEYQGSTVLLACGGPHIELRTDKREVRGWWGGGSWSSPIDGDICDYYEEFAII